MTNHALNTILYRSPCNTPSAGSNGHANTIFNALLDNPSQPASNTMAGIGASLLALREIEPSFLAQASDETQPAPMSSALILAKEKSRNALWTKGLYQQVTDRGQTVNTYSGLLGYDFFYSTGSLSGVVGYLRSNLEPTTAASGHTNTLTAAIHGVSGMPQSTFVEYGLIGCMGFNHLNRLGAATSKGSFHSYSLDPFVNFGYDWSATRWLMVEPFVRTQYIFEFQNAYNETGPSSNNLHHSSLNSGLFYLEPGCNFYEHWHKSWGMLVIRQKISYIRTQAMYGSTTQLSFINSGSGDFTTSSGLLSENFVGTSFQVLARFEAGPFISATYRGQWGDSFQLNEARLRVGCYF